MSDIPDIDHYLTREEAITFVKRVDRTNSGKFCLSVRLDAAVAGNPERVYGDGLVSYLEISRAQALRLVGTILSPTLQARGGRIRIRETRSQIGSKVLVTYWITQ